MATVKRPRSTSTELKRTKKTDPVTAAGKLRENLSNGNLEEAIRLRAYLLWEQEGGIHGQDVNYWLRAESELAPHNVR
ncbi:MAG TPA: DUF2934 domain-containing protein [Terriglobales bacterium]|nr:DUF2934 domain-containing protein [Terriglobales bacterium]